MSQDKHPADDDLMRLWEANAHNPNYNADDDWACIHPGLKPDWYEKSHPKSHNQYTPTYPAQALDLRLNLSSNPTIPGHDYSGIATYFVTIIKEEFALALAELKQVQTSAGTHFTAHPTSEGRIIQQAIAALNRESPRAKITHHAIMPDHLHLLLQINDTLSESPWLYIRTLINECNAHYTATQSIAAETDTLLLKTQFHHIICQTQAHIHYLTDYMVTNPRRIAIRENTPDFATRRINTLYNNKTITLMGNTQLLDSPLLIPHTPTIPSNPSIPPSSIPPSPILPSPKISSTSTISSASSHPTTPVTPSVPSGSSASSDPSISSEQLLQAAENNATIITAALTPDETTLITRAVNKGARIIYILPTPLPQHPLLTDADRALLHTGRLLLIAPTQRPTLTPSNPHPLLQSPSNPLSQSPSNPLSQSTSNPPHQFPSNTFLQSTNNPHQPLSTSNSKPYISSIPLIENIRSFIIALSDYTIPRPNH